MKTVLGLSFTLLLASSVASQDAKKKPAAAAVDQKAIDTAILKGLEYLKTAPSTGGHLQGHCDELILLTMLHGGASEKTYQKFLDSSLSGPLEKTYKVALLAMSLYEIDPSAYQMKIAQCAQFLVDNQCQNGQWSYGSPTEAVKEIPFTAPEKKVASGGRREIREFGGEKDIKKPGRSLAVKPTRQGPEKGDNSNTQYASLGLRACFDSNVKVPEEIIYKARQWWVESQFPDELGEKAGKNAVASGEVTKIAGWNYTKPGGDEPRPAYHAMTAGAVGAVCIYEHMLGRDWKKDPVAKAGVNWLAKHFAVNTNYYYMYGLERAGMLYGTENFGDRMWYYEGAALLLRNQKADGSWGTREKVEENTWDTCFAILFLKKATRAIASVEKR
jgi:hypothetical protein